MKTNQFRKNKKDVTSEVIEQMNDPTTQTLDTPTVLDINQVSKPRPVLTPQPKMAPKDKEYEKLEESLGLKGRKVERVPLKLLVDAPPEWNDFPPLSELELTELELSIETNGLYHHFILWKQEDGTYMILSGHNRKKAYQNILLKYMDSEILSPEQIKEIQETYSAVTAQVYQCSEIDSNKAQEIIMDVNYNQRKEINSILPLIIYKRYNLTKNYTDKEGRRTRDIVAEKLNVGPTKVSEDVSIVSKGHEEIVKLYCSKKLKKKLVLKIVQLNKELQGQLISYYKQDQEQFEAKALKLFSTYKTTHITSDVISKMFDENINLQQQLVTVSFKVPRGLKQEFQKVAGEWIKQQQQ